MGGNYFWLESSQFKRPCKPIEDVDKNGLALCRCANRRISLNWTIRGSVDGISVDGEPIADAAKALLEFRLNDSVRLWVNIEKEIAATARHLNEASNEKLGRLVVMVVHVVGPGVVDGHAGFPKLKVFRMGNAWLQLVLDVLIHGRKVHVFGGNRFRNELFRSYIIAGNADAIIHQRRGLQASNELDKPLAIVFLLVIQAVEPDQDNRPILR